MSRRSRDTITSTQPTHSNKRARISSTQPSNQSDDQSEDESDNLNQQVSSRTFTRPGSIFRISVTNFMIYTKKTIFPGPHLNLILGPNGSGKSTLICAICLGLGGQAKSIGRMKNLSEFIKIGHDESRIEIELFFPPGYEADQSNSQSQRSQSSNQNGNIVIARTIDSANHSHYEIGRYDSRGDVKFADFGAREIQEFMKKYNIHVDNLCVLLAQDRVGAFAEMKPSEVLIETEKAANQELYEQHQKLIALRKDEKSQSNNLEEMKKSLESKETELESLEPEVARQVERESISKKLDRLVRLKPWLKYRESTLSIDSLKQQIDHANKKLKDVQASQQPLLAAKNQALRLSDEANRAKTAAENALKAPDNARKQQMQALDAGNRAIQEKRDQIVDLRERQRQHASRLQQAQDDVDAQRVKVDNLSTDADIIERKRVADAGFQTLKHESATITRKIASINQKCADLRHEIGALESQMRNKHDQSSRKNEQLFERCRDQKALQEYRMVQDLLAKQRHVRAKGSAADNDRSVNDPASDKYVLRGDVIGPVAMNIDYSWSPMGVVLENALNYRNKWSYICSETDDALYLSKQRTRFVVHQNMSHMPSTMQSNSHRLRPDLSRFAQFGADLRFAADELVCDDMLMRWLHDSTSLAMTVVSANELTTAQIAAVFPSGQQQARGQTINILYTPKSQFTQRFSRYGNRAQTLNDRTNQPVRLFTPKNSQSNNDNDEEMNEARASIAQKKELLAVETDSLKAVQASQQQLNVRNQANAAERTKLEQALRENRSQIDQLHRLERELQQLQRGVDYDGKVTALNREIAVLLEKQVKNVTMLSEIERRWAVCLMSLDLALLGAKQRETELQYMTSRLTSFQHDITQAQRALDQAKNDYQVHMRHVNELKRAAEHVCRESDLGDVSDLPNSHGQCEEEIEHCEASLEAMSSSNSNAVLSRYARLQGEVEKLREQCSSHEETVGAKSQEIQWLKSEWLSELTVLVNAVNDRFAYYMSRIKCNGGVVLQQQSDDFDAWSLLIQVSYRAGEALKVLSSGSQSGGEKSVATMLYLLSLQHVTNAPFRIVDEINQGMDPANERNVFQQIVHASTHGKHQSSSSSDATPQYIVVTPKLLPGLEMPESSGVHCICVYGGEFADAGETRPSQRPLSQRYSFSQAGGRASQGAMDSSYPVTKWDSVDETIKQAARWREIRST